MNQRPDYSPASWPLSIDFGVDLEPEAHQYTFRGTRMHGVTTVLSKLNLSPTYPTRTDFYTLRGTAVHKMIELYIRQILDLDGTSDSVKRFLPSWQRYQSDHRPTIIYSEQRVVECSMVYCGTIDLIGILPSGQPYLMDLKTSDTASEAAPSTDLQTAAYLTAYLYCVQQGYLPRIPALDRPISEWRRFALLLLPDDQPQGKPYRLTSYDEQTSYQAWAGACYVYHWSIGSFKKK